MTATPQNTVKVTLICTPKLMHTMQENDNHPFNNLPLISTATQKPTVYGITKSRNVYIRSTLNLVEHSWIGHSNLSKIGEQIRASEVLMAQLDEFYLVIELRDTNLNVTVTNGALLDSSIDISVNVNIDSDQLKVVDESELTAHILSVAGVFQETEIDLEDGTATIALGPSKRPGFMLLDVSDRDDENAIVYVSENEARKIMKVLELFVGGNPDK